MAGNRKAAETTALKWVNEIDPSGESGKLLAGFFKNMNDKQFDAWILALKEGRDYLPINVPAMGRCAITVENNLKIAEKHGIPIFERIWVTDPSTGSTYLSPIKYPVVYLPVRRQVQSLVKKVSIPEDNKHMDELTDQPIGASKGSAVTFPEIQVIYAQGFEKSLLELIKFRGGDTKGWRAMEKAQIEGGSASVEALDQLGTRTKSTDTVNTLFKMAHLDNTF